MFYPGYTLRARVSIPTRVEEVYSARFIHTSSVWTDGDVQGLVTATPDTTSSTGTSDINDASITATNRFETTQDLQITSIDQVLRKNRKIVWIAVRTNHPKFTSASLYPSGAGITDDEAAWTVKGSLPNYESMRDLQIVAARGFNDSEQSMWVQTNCPELPFANLYHRTLAMHNGECYTRQNDEAEAAHASQMPDAGSNVSPEEVDATQERWTTENTPVLTMDVCESMDILPRIVITDIDEVVPSPHHEDNIDQAHCEVVAYTSHLALLGLRTIAAAEDGRGDLQVHRGHDHDQNIRPDPRGAARLEGVVPVEERPVVTIHLWHIVIMLLCLWALWGLLDQALLIKGKMDLGDLYWLVMAIAWR
jgi:hypothetical protein